MARKQKNQQWEIDEWDDSLDVGSPGFSGKTPSSAQIPGGDPDDWGSDLPPEWNTPSSGRRGGPGNGRKILLIALAVFLVLAAGILLLIRLFRLLRGKVRRKKKIKTINPQERYYR